MSTEAMRGAELRAHLHLPRTGFDIDIDIEVAAGETLALMGPSGAGKSSVLHAIAGIDQIAAGTVRLDGETLAGPGLHLPPHRRAIGMLGQDPRLFPHLTAYSNIVFGGRAGGCTKQEAEKIADSWLSQLDLNEVSGQRPSQLSGGQRQRVALARALAAQPRLLLIDEPFASLDVEVAADMRILVRDELARSGTTALVVSHSAADAVGLAHRLMVIERGRVVQEGAVRDVLAAPATSFVRAVSITLYGEQKLPTRAAAVEAPRETES